MSPFSQVVKKYLIKYINQLFFFTMRAHEANKNGFIPKLSLDRVSQQEFSFFDSVEIPLLFKPPGTPGNAKGVRCQSPRFLRDLCTPGGFNCKGQGSGFRVGDLVCGRHCEFTVRHRILCKRDLSTPPRGKTPSGFL